MFSIKTDMKFSVLFIFGIVLASFVFTTSIFADNNQEQELINKNRVKITISETNFVKKPYVFLKDIAAIHANQFLKETLDNIEVGRSPKPGQVKVFDKNKILSLVEHQLYLSENIIFTSPSQIYVKRLSQEISKKEIRQFVELELAKIFKGKDYKLKKLHIRGLEQYPEGKIKLQFDSNEMINNSGKLKFYINVIIDGNQEDRLNISGQIVVYENIFFAQNEFARGDLISQDFVYQERKDIYSLRGGFVTSFDDLDGKTVKSTVRKGDYFKHNILAESPLIKKGDIVRLIFKNDNLLIVTSGLSKENGFENELIKVENLGSGRLVRGIVKEKSKVEVVY